MENRSNITFYVNQKKVEVSSYQFHWPLAEFLRHELGLVGTKVVCAEGDCGACTVLIAKPKNVHDDLKYKAVNSCIMPLMILDGHHIITVEGVSSDQDQLHPVQKAMIDHHGTQCGYCTPGFICSMTAMVEELKIEKKSLSTKKIKNYLTGNLCRCTGYKPIIEAASTLQLSNIDSLNKIYNDEKRNSELVTLCKIPVQSQFLDTNYFLPTTLEDALEIKNKYLDLKIIAGGTDLGVVANKGRITLTKIMSLQNIDKLNEISIDSNFIKIGALVTLSKFEKYIDAHLKEMSNLLHIFASPQIKNQGTITGNVINGSPIGDTIPFLLIANAVVCMSSVNGHREIELTKFYKAYKDFDLKPNEIVTGIKIPLAITKNKVKLYKSSIRKDLDISAVTFAGAIELDGKKIKEIKLALGGVAGTVIRLDLIEKELRGKDFKTSLFTDAANQLPALITPLSDLRGSKEYRMKLSQNFLMKFSDELIQEGSV